MKSVLLRLLLASAVLGTVAALLYTLLGRETGETVAAVDAGAATQDASGQRPTGRAVLETLQRIGEASQRLMPDGYNQVFVGMGLDDLRRARPAVHRDSQQARADGQQVWEEDDPNGARVIYLVTARGSLVSQVQFLSRLDGTEALAPHFQALQAKYGSPTGVWDCPETAETSPMRRFTWRREDASLMEAVLIYNNTVALTLVVSATEDVGAALARSRCTAVRDAESVARFPVAGEMRGERHTFMREVPRDASR